MPRKSKEQMEKEAAGAREKQQQQAASASTPNPDAPTNPPQQVISNEPGPEDVGEDSAPDGGPPRIASGELQRADGQTTEETSEGSQEASQDATGASGDPMDNRPTLSRDSVGQGAAEADGNDVKPTPAQVQSELDVKGDTQPIVDSGDASRPQVLQSADERPGRYKVVRGMVGSFTPGSGMFSRSDLPGVDDARLQRLISDGYIQDLDAR